MVCVYGMCMVCVYGMCIVYGMLWYGIVSYRMYVGMYNVPASPLKPPHHSSQTLQIPNGLHILPLSNDQI